MSAPLLQLENLSARRGATPVLRNIALAVQPGERVALIGDNGAGKSSLLLAIAGHLPTQGSARFAGQDIAAAPAHRRARLGIGFCPEGRRVFAGMSVSDNLAVASRERQPDPASVYRLFPELERRRHTMAWQLSGGEQQMLAVGRALMGRPRLLLLDEPFLGLSPDAGARLLEALRTIALGGVSLLLADQDLERSQSLCERSIFLDRGEIRL
ncbi:MAG: branched-chain amino acid transporter ATP-binding protein [Alphaproteobacteria bacterium]|jgi:branched-chain amino acid transport system ATP-binding protein|nr:branched-chain amino acid transporter ATP-binding protein [Alphaproteobacteria bacterium]